MNVLLALLVWFMSAIPAAAWKPLPNYQGRLSSQAIALCCPCNHVLLSGTRGSAKSETQLAYFRRYVGIGYGKFWRGVIFDREYKNLDDLVAKSKKLFGRFGDGARFIASQGAYKWVWPTGEELLFRAVKKADDYQDFHGHEYPFIGWNELTKFPTSELYDLMMSCNRSSFLPASDSPTGRLLPDIPLVVLSTTNPHGPGHNWVKRRFILAGGPGKVVRSTVEVFNPRTGKREPVTKTQTWIFCSYKENVFLSPEYVLELERITDPARRKAWLLGDWDINSGGALDGVWNERYVVIPRFKLPRTFYADRSFDWGSSAPFSVGWWAEANGEEIELPDGSAWCPSRGSLIRFHEWYGTAEIGTNKGMGLSAKAIADGIKIREAELIACGWAHVIKPGPADNAIATSDDPGSPSIKQKMADQGVRWTESNKGPGSRVNGLQLIKDRLEAARTGEGPAIYVMDHCTASRELMPAAPRSDTNPDDIDTDSEDHIVDEWRYRVLAWQPRAPQGLRVHFPS